MKELTFSKAQSSLWILMDEVCQCHAPIAITRGNGDDGGAVVLISLADYEGLLETMYLLDSPANAARLTQSIRQVQGNIEKANVKRPPNNQGSS